MTLPSGTEPGNRTVAEPRPFTLEPDRAFVGCLMQLPPAAARGLLAGVRPDDAHSTITQRVLFLVIRLAAREIKPDPVVLLTEARNQGWLTTRHRHEQFATWLIDTFRAAPAPQAGQVVKRDMLEHALRWAITQRAKAVADITEHREIDRVREYATFDTDRISDLWARLTDAAQAITPATPDSAVYGQIRALSGRDRSDTAEVSTPEDRAATASAPATSDPETNGRAA